MNLADALGDDQSGGGSVWPGQPNAPSWPGQPPANPVWNGGHSAGGGMWPGQPGPQPTAPGGWPSPASGPGAGGWPSPASGPGAGGWPSPASGPGAGGWPSPASGPGAGGWPSPASGPGAGGWPSPASGPGPSPVAQDQNLTVPYKLNLPNGIYDKLLITIAGTIKPNADKIIVDMTTPRDLAFHFNPRFNDNGRKVIVRNSCIGKKWGPEERELQHFPFVRGQPFEIKILCTGHEYRVTVNKSPLLTYRHRITDLRSINAVNIYNDLTLSKVHVETLP